MLRYRAHLREVLDRCTAAGFTRAFVVGGDANGPLRHGGALRDVGPTVLRMLDIEPPPEMTGRDLRDVP